MADEAEVIAESTEVEEAPVKRGRGRPKGTTKSGLPYVPKPKSGLGRGRPKGTSNLKHLFLFMPPIVCVGLRRFESSKMVLIACKMSLSN